MQDKREDISAYEERMKKYFGFGFLDVSKRLEILYNNPNFELEDKELTELLEQQSGFGRGRKENWKYKIYFKNDYEDYLKNLKEEIKKITSLSYEADVLKLWGNHKKILYKLGDLEVNSKIENKKKTNYEAKQIKTYKEIEKILNDEYFLFDTETTGFNVLNQVIEFGGIIYNRKVTNDPIRINEVLKAKNLSSKSILSLFKYIDKDFLFSEGIDILESYSGILTELHKYKKSKNKEERDLFFEKLNELSFRLLDYITIDKKEFNYLLLLVDEFELKHNRKIHFYIKPYKDYITEQTYSIHHISNELIMEKGLELDVVIEGLQKILKDQVILAHNVGFDMTKIQELFNDGKVKGPRIKAWYDTIDLFQVLNKEIGLGTRITKFNLDYLSKVYLGVDLKMETDDTKDRHTAIFDVKLTKANIDKIYNQTKEYKVNIEKIKEKQKEMEDKLKQEELDFKEFLNKIETVNKEKKNLLIKNFHSEIIEKILLFDKDTFVYNELNHLIMNYISNVGIENNEIKKYLLKNVKEELYSNIEDYMGLKKRNFEIENYFLNNINNVDGAKKSNKGKTHEKNLTLF